MGDTLMVGKLLEPHAAVSDKYVTQLITALSHGAVPAFSSVAIRRLRRFSSPALICQLFDAISSSRPATEPFDLLSLPARFPPQFDGLASSLLGLLGRFRRINCRSPTILRLPELSGP